MVRTFLFLLINAHLIISVVLLFLIIRHSIKLYSERRRKVPGSAFKRNLFFAFIIFSVIPVVSISFIAGKLITTSIDNWFEARIGAGLENSLYLHEKHTSKGRDEIRNMGDSTLSRLSSMGAPSEGESFQDLIARNLGELKKKHQNLKNYEIYVWGNNGTSFFGSIDDEIKTWRTFRKVNDRTTRGLKSLFFDNFISKKLFDFYGSLYWSKKITIPFITEDLSLVLAHRYPAHIRNHMIEIQYALLDYNQLKLIKNPIYWSYFLAFLLVTLLILFLAIWCAFFLARGISRPIQELLLAIRKIRSGDLKTRVTIDPPDDLKHLVNGFNEMTHSLQRAYQNLEFHNEEMVTMLKHIKESVFFVNNYGRILSFNVAGKKLIEDYLHVTRFKNKRINFLGNYVKEIFFSIVRELKKTDKTYLSREISFSHEGEPKTFMIYVAIVQSSSLKPFVVVVEDMSDVYKMNKIKTWQEAAKQMAHEVKNPLTPIQLATQRLQRKLRKKGYDDPELMDCADTILHQVRTIKDLVTHFSEFAKMPDSKIEQLDINNIIKEIGALYEMSYPDINMDYELKDFLPAFKADRKKMNRVVVNLLDNSVRALANFDDRSISLKTSFKTGRNQIELVISDNGPGIPKDVKEKLFLPYVSSGNKNMGLGLAIVHDIVVQAGGSIKLLSSSQGATFQILLPV